MNQPANLRHALREKLLSQALRDPLFHSMLHAAAVDVSDESVEAANEATVESIFENILYATLRDIGVSFHPIKENPIKTRRHVAKGRTDSRLGALVIEYKHPAALSTASEIADAKEQLYTYLEAVSLELDTTSVGWLIDGTKACELRYTSPDGTKTDGGFVPISGEQLLRLTRQIVSLGQSALTPGNLIKDFCANDYHGIIFQLARDLSKILNDSSTSKSEMLLTEWTELFRLAHDDESQQRRIEDRRAILARIFAYSIDDAPLEYQSLFCLHTAYAIVLKMMAYRVVCDVKFSAPMQSFKSIATADSDALRAFCAALEDGDLFRQIGFLNLLEGDFFSWYADEHQWTEQIAASIQQIAETLARYEDVKEMFSETTSIDLFRLLYEATVPQTVRASFGEFYTPSWLAQHTINTTNLHEKPSTLDPCCGSGTFLVAAIATLRGAGLRKPFTAKDIMSHVMGIDLNPLAVLTARVNYFISLADLIEEESLDSFVIPVFLGDASNVPKLVEEEGVIFISYELKTLKTPLLIALPASMCNDYESFAQIMLAFENHVKHGDFALAKDMLVEAALQSENEPIVRLRVEELADQLITLEQRGWNGIWARIITNFVATSRIGPFDSVVGNPPWIDWKSLPSGYREKVKALCIDKGLFSGAGRTGGINLNICALIAHVAATNWLAPEGTLAFLMPRELIYQSSYEGWRTSVGGDDLSLVEVHDWSKAGHPFDPVKEDFLTFVFQRGQDHAQEIPVYKYNKITKKNQASEWTSLREALDMLTIEEMSADRLIEGKSRFTIGRDSAELAKFRLIAGECSYVGREGLEFYPQELMIFRFEEVGPKPGTAWLRNIQSQKSKYKIPEQRVLVETRYLFPLVKGPGIVRMKYEDPDLYVFFPYEAEDPKAPLSQADLQDMSPLLLEYLRKFRVQLEQQTSYSDTIRGPGEFYGVARSGPYSFQNCHVAFRDNTHWRVTVLGMKETPWGEAKRYLFQNHAVSMCERVDGQYIGHTEALFVAGILGTPIVESFIYASSDNRSFSIRPPVYVPLYDPNDAQHAKIVQLTSRALRASDDLVLEAGREIESIYLEMAGNRS